MEAAQGRFEELAASFDQCRNDQPAAACLRSVVGSLSIVNDSATVRESTMTGLLLDHRGSCAALVALALSWEPSAWNAYVLRDHVLLRSTGNSPRLLELTDQAREISERELRNRFRSQVDFAVVVPAKRFPAYYLDNLAVRVAAEGRADEAERLFRHAIEIGPKEGRVRLNAGTFLLERGRLEEAEAQLRAAVRLSPNDADAWTNLGVALARCGKTGRAAASFERALRIDPAHRAARTNLKALNVPSAERTGAPGTPR